MSMQSLTNFKLNYYKSLFYLFYLYCLCFYLYLYYLLLIFIDIFNLIFTFITSNKNLSYLYFYSIYQQKKGTNN